jgi:Actin interacting protein 3
MLSPRWPDMRHLHVKFIGLTLWQPAMQISQIEKSVTHLLVATKQLLETLTQWSRKQAQEEEVSDVYVRLGYEFNLACRAFNSIGVETSDLGPVPDLLRSILEDTLSQAASPQALDNYLPRIRDIIINLLHGLKRKQSKLRNRPAKEGTSTRSGMVGRQGSGASFGSSETGLTNMEDAPSPATSTRAESRQDSIRSTDDQTYMSAKGFATPSGDRGSSIRRQSGRRDGSRPGAQSDSTSSMSSTTAQNMPVLLPYADSDHTSTALETPFPHPPPPPPKQQDALTALQRGGDLERRASRRFSSFQIQKHLGASPNGIPVIPPAQKSPIPNRGREVRESMSAVRSRTSYRTPQSKSNTRLAEISPSRSGPVKTSQRISEEREELPMPPTMQDPPHISPPTESAIEDSPTVKTPDEFHRPLRSEVSDPSEPVLGATVNGPWSPVPILVTPENEDFKPSPPEHQQPVKASTDDDARQTTVERKTRSNVTPPQSQLLELDSPPPPGKELTLFLQYKSKVKKFVLAEGYPELTIARLQLAFIEKFAWNTHNNGVDLPEIYLQDPVSGIRHELEDLSDVKDRSVLVLNVEVLDEVKRHFDDGIGGLRRTLEGVKSLLDGQGALMQRFSDRQLETSKEMARISSAPRRNISRISPSAPGSSTATQTTVSLEEIQRLRRDIAVLRQTYSNMSSDFAAAMTDIKAKAENVKAVAADATVPSYEGDAGRAHINSGKKALTADSETLVNHVDDLQDRVEDLRKDVVMRGVRPLPRQLEELSREIGAAVKDLGKMKDFIKREKPIWTKIWEHELNLVCTERDELTSHEDLVSDLTTDLDDLNEVFKLVEEAMKQQNLQSGGGATGLRSTSRTLPFNTDTNPQRAKDGVLGEVRALQPNHENRLEAIERAEKLRQKDLESRKGDEFQREVERFVEEGKLKKTGGADEVERLRKLKDERARKENWDRAQARLAAMDARAAEEAKAAAGPKPENGEQTTAPVSGPEGSHSQEGAAAFEDGNKHKLSSAAPTPPPPAADTKGIEDVESKRDSDGPPQLPEMVQDSLGASLLEG